MNGLDYAFIAIIGFGALYGLSHGVLRMATSILSFVLGIYAASIWHGRAGALAQYHLGTSPATSEIIGYVAVFVLVFIAIEFAGRRLILAAHIVNLNLVDRLGGAVFGAVLATVFAGLDIVILTAVLPPDYPLLRNSKLAARILSYDEALLDYVPVEVKQVYQEKHDQLVSYWNGRNKNPATTPDEAR
jgi:membrane protein required for colicin V production